MIKKVFLWVSIYKLIKLFETNVMFLHILCVNIVCNRLSNGETNATLL
jgi:hypothetical protein